jgi:hypothetical protein
VTLRKGLFLAGDRAKVGDQASNIIIQGLRFRETNGTPGHDNLTIFANCHDIVVDHCSFAEAGSDGAVDIVFGSHNITFSWNMLFPPQGEGKAMHGVGYQSHKSSVHHNLYFDCPRRTPLCHAAPRSGVAVSGPPSTSPHVDVRYNISWDYSVHAITFGKTDGNIVANLLKYKGAKGLGAHNTIRVKECKAYVAGNVSVHDPRGAQYETNHVVKTTNGMSNNADPFDTPAISGPKPTDKEGRLAEWTKVVKQSGPCGEGTKFAGQDDAFEARARKEVKVPGMEVFDQPWNDQ